MADIKIAKPAAGTSENIPSESGARYIFEFSPADATVLKGGDNLEFNFDDGAQIVLQDFYSEHDPENQHIYVVDGQEITTEQLFAAMDAENLMPAAGPEAGAETEADGARYRAYGDMAFADGIDHLWHLDWGMSRAFDSDEEFNSYGLGNDAGVDTLAQSVVVPGSGIPSIRPEPGTPDYDPPHDYIPPQLPSMPVPPTHPGLPEITPPPSVDGNPGIPDNPVAVRPENPDRPDQDGPNGGDPANPGDPGLPGHNPNGTLNINTDKDVLTVYEKFLKDGTEDGNGPLVVEGAMDIYAPDGVSKIEIGGKVIWENGSLVDDPTIKTDEGTFTVTGFDPLTGKLTYEFELERPTGEHGKPGDDSISHTLTVVVTDTDGDQGASSIKINIVDDVPAATTDREDIRAGETISGNVLENDAHGADGKGAFPEGATVRWDLPAGATSNPDGSHTVEYPGKGTITLNPDGSYEFKSDPNAPNGDLPEIPYFIVDSDGDISQAGLTIGIVNSNGEKPENPDKPEQPENPDKPQPGPENPDKPLPEPEKPGKPEQPEKPESPRPEPENPDKPQPGPENPDKPLPEPEKPNKPVVNIPQQPEDPNDPAGKPASVKGAAIVVDEAAMDNGTGSDGHHSHGHTGSHEFTVNVHGEKGGNIALSFGGKELLLEIPKDDAKTIEVKGNATFKNVNGVDITITGAELRADGLWHVTYSYELTRAQNHGKENVTGADDAIYSGKDGGIKVVVTDGVNNDKSAPAYITVEVHDDGPEISVVAPADVTAGGGMVSGKWDFDFGADLPESQIIEISTADGKTTATLDTGNPGNFVTITTADGVLTVYADKHYTFDPASKVGTGSKAPEFVFKIVDSDQDAASANLTIDIEDKTSSSITVLKPTDDGRHDDPYSGDGVDNPGPNAPGNDIIIADIHGQQGETHNLNVALLVDVSNSLYTSAGKTYMNLAVLQQQLCKGITDLWTNAQAEGVGQVNVMLVGFDLIARNYTEVTLKSQSDYEALISSIKNLNLGFTNPGSATLDGVEYNFAGDKLYGGKDLGHSDKSFYPGSDSALGATNYEVALSLANDWFNKLQGQQTNLEGTIANKTYIITDGVPTVHTVELKGTQNIRFSTEFKNVNNKDVDFSNLVWTDGKAWKPGETASFTASDMTFFVDKSGAIFNDDDMTRLVTLEDATFVSGGTTYHGGALVMKMGASGKYEVTGVMGATLTGPQYVGSSSTVVPGQSVDHSLKYFDSVKDNLGSVHVLGIGENTVSQQEFKDRLDKFDTSGGAQVTPNFGGLGDNLGQTWKDLPAGNDVVFGAEGRDILIGDRIYDGLVDGVAGTIDALKGMLPNGQGLSDAEVGEAMFANAREVAQKLDALDFKNNDGNDTLIGGQDDDLLFGMGGDDLLFGDGNADSARQLADVLATLGIQVGEATTANLTNAIGKIADADVLQQLSDRMEGLENADGRQGDDMLFGGKGEDVLFGGGGADQLYGGDGNDVLLGGSGDDVLDGGDGDDVLLGGSGADLLYGGAGDDVLFGGSGADKLHGGEGNDILIYDREDVLIDGGLGIDFLLADVVEGPTLDAMLGNGDQDGGQLVSGVEVLIKGAGHLDSMEELEDVYGVKVDGDKLVLDAEKWEKAEIQTGKNTVTWKNGEVTLETTLFEDTGSGDSLSQAQSIILTETGGSC